MENQTNRSNGASTGAPGSPNASATSPDGLKDTYRHLLIPGERYASLMEVVGRTEAELRPLGGVEDFLFIDLATNHWRIWRYQALEAALLNHEITLHGVYSTNRFPGGPAVSAMQTTRGYNGMLHLLYRLEAMARRAYQSTLRTLLDYRARLLRYRRDVGVHDNDPPYPPTPVATKQNEPNQTETTTEQTTTKETPCNPQPDSQPID